MHGKMKAQVFYRPENMKLESINIPSIADTEVLIRVRSVGICGSDKSYYFGHSPLGTKNGNGPLILGHEMSGEIVEIGAIPTALGLFKLGDRVVVNPVQQCNACDMCSRGKVNLCPNLVIPGVNVNGGMAEYCKARYTHVYPMPNNMSYEEGSLIEPLACAVYAVQKAEIGLGDRVAIFGPGPIGLLMVQLAKSAGAGKIILIGTSDYLLRSGEEAGADELINIKDEHSAFYSDHVIRKIKELTDGKMADKVLVPTSALNAMQNAIEASGNGAIIVFFGLPNPDDTLHIPVLSTLTADKTIKFSWLAPLVWPNAIQSVATGAVDVNRIVTHRFTLDRGETGIRFMKQAKENKIKGLIIID